MRHNLNRIQGDLKDLAPKDTVEKIERELKELATSRAVDKIDEQLEKTNDQLKELNSSHEGLRHSVSALERRFEEALGRETPLATRDYIAEVMREQTERFEQLIAPLKQA